MIVLAGVWGTLAAMISWGVLVITIPLLVLAALASKRPSRVRIHLDIARLAVSIVAILLMAAFVRVSTPGGFIVIALVLGGILGAVQGLAAKPVNADGELLVGKSAIGIALWGVGVVAMQAAGILSRTGTLQLGQSLAWFGAGVLAGTIIGRQRRLTEHARSRVVVHTLIALVSVSTLFGLMGALDPSARAADGRWVLVETRTNPYDAQTEFIVGITPDYFESPRYDGTFSRIEVAAEGISRHSRSVERGTEDYNINAVFNLTTPPTDLVPGETVTLSASGSASGVHNGWNPFEQFEFRAEGVRLEGTTAFAIGLNPSYYSASGSASPTFTVPSPSSAEAEIVIQAFLWNCPACLVEWVYRAELAPSSPTDTAGSVPSTVPPVTDGSSSDVTDPTAGISPDGPTPSDAPTSQGDSDQPISGTRGDDGPPQAVPPAAAAGQAIGGLVAAAAIGLISIVDAGMMSSPLTGQGPLRPTDARGIINDLLSGNSAEAGTPMPAPPPLPPPPSSVPEPGRVFVDDDRLLGGGAAPEPGVEGVVGPSLVPEPGVEGVVGPSLVPEPGVEGVVGPSLVPEPGVEGVVGPSLVPEPGRVFVDDDRLLGGGAAPEPGVEGVVGPSLVPEPGVEGVVGPSLVPEPGRVFVDDDRLLGGGAAPIPPAQDAPVPPGAQLPDPVPMPPSPQTPAVPTPSVTSPDLPPPPPPPPATEVPPPPPATEVLPPPPPATEVPPPPPPATEVPPPPPATEVPPPPPPATEVSPPPAFASEVPPPPPATEVPPAPSPGAPVAEVSSQVGTGTEPPPQSSGPVASQKSTTGNVSPQRPASGVPDGGSPTGKTERSGAGMAAGAAAAAGAASVASRAAAAQKRVMRGEAERKLPRVRVTGPTDVYGLSDHGSIVGRLAPGVSCTAIAIYEDWVHIVDETSRLEGWVARRSVIEL